MNAVDSPEALMNPSNDGNLPRCKRLRQLQRRRGGARTILLVLTVMLVGFGLLGTRALEAQQKATRSVLPLRAPMDYQQVQIVWTNMAETLNKWEAKGWETFQIIPIQPANPGIGAPMTVAVLFRRPAK